MLNAVRPVLVGPVTLLALSKQADGSSTQPLEHLDAVVESYISVLEQLHAAGVEWVQLNEPALVADLAAADDAALAQALLSAYRRILAAEKRPQVYLTTPYGSVRKGLDAINELQPEAVQVDLSVGTLALDPSYLERVAGLKSHLSAGLVDGRNVWAANLRDLRAKLETLPGASVTTSVSLQHVPHTVEAETSLPIDVANWFSFANEKVREVVALSSGPLAAPEAYAQADRAVRTRAESARTHNEAVQNRTAQLPEGEVQRQPLFAERNEAQKLACRCCRARPSVPSHKRRRFVRHVRLTARARFPTPPTSTPCATRSSRSSSCKNAWAWTCWCTASQSATTWCSTSPSCSTASWSPKTAGSSLMAPAAPVRQSWWATSPARRR